MEDTGTATELRGIELRYVVTVMLLDQMRELTLVEVVDGLAALGIRVRGRPSKTISDALRWEVRKGRVVRVGRGRYGPGRMPRSTEWWLRRRVDSLMR
jgi:hypothetical protein